MSKIIKKAGEKFHSLYSRLERPISSISLIGGFVFDAVTLKRVDLLKENIWIGAHLLAAAIGIIVLNRYEMKKERRAERFLKAESVSEVGKEGEDKIRFWLTMLIQFSFGGLFSTFIVFYFRSATLSATWPFLLLLAVVFIMNERFRKHYARLTFQVSVFFIAFYAFAIYLVPVVLHSIGDAEFLVAGLLSLVVLWFFISELKLVSRERFNNGSGTLLYLTIGLIFLCVNGLYFAKLIPPIPLSLKDAGIYHSVTRNADGNYEVIGENRGWFETIGDYLFSNEDVHVVNGEAVYAFAAIFSPNDLNVKIVHEWQYYNPNAEVKGKNPDGSTAYFGAWKTTDRLSQSIVGGRDGGYRSWSKKSSLVPGLWRVNILTENGRVIGRIKFNVVNIATEFDREGKVEIKE